MHGNNWLSFFCKHIEERLYQCFNRVPSGALSHWVSNRARLSFPPPSGTRNSWYSLPRFDFDFDFDSGENQTHALDSKLLYTILLGGDKRSKLSVVGTASV